MDEPGGQHGHGAHVLNAEENNDFKKQFNMQFVGSTSSEREGCKGAGWHGGSKLLCWTPSTVGRRALPESTSVPGRFSGASGYGRPALPGLWSCLCGVHSAR
jgi:hypothetical protein